MEEMKGYNRPKRQIVVMALRYAIAVVQGELEDDGRMRDLETVRAEFNDIQAMHANLTGEAWIT